MEWDALGAVAETAGAVGVILTLGYLALQTRDSAKVTRAQAIWDAQLSFVQINELLGDGGVISEVVYRAIDDPDALTAYEKYLAQRFLRSYLQRVEAQFALYRSGVLDEEVWNLRCSYTRSVLNLPFFAEIWELEKRNSMFTKAFIMAVDSTDVPGMARFAGVGQE